MRKTITQNPIPAQFGTLMKESDKGCVLIMGSILEELLSQFHKVYIAKTTNEARGIFKSLSSPYAPLSTFAGKIQLAYAYGLIPYENYEDLEIIRALRNEAAHCTFNFSLKNTGVFAKVKRMKMCADTRTEPLLVQLSKVKNEILKAKIQFLLKGLALCCILRDKTRALSLDTSSDS
jgi:DNA-binding MltR family transcriptional regulator